MRNLILSLLILIFSDTAFAQIDDLSTAFGARTAVQQMSLSPDGTKIAFVASTKGQASRLQTIDLAAGNKVTNILAASGKPERLGGCGWVSHTRLACLIYGTLYDGIAPNYFTRIVAVNADGTGLKMLSNRQSDRALYRALAGGGILDYLPGKDGKVLMARPYVPEGKIGSLITKTEEGLGVDEIDSTTLQSKRVVKPVRDAILFISDGKGEVRIMGLADLRADYLSGVTKYRFRPKGSTDWQYLSDYDSVANTGFQPMVIDETDNSVLGFEKLDGRIAVYRVKLDGTGQKTLVFSHDKVDSDSIVTIGRSNRPIGVGYVLNERMVQYFDPELEALRGRLAKAMPGLALSIIDASEDEQKLLIWATSDINAGQYFLLDRSTKQLRPLLAARPELQQVQLAKVRPVEVLASDGTKVPAYLTLPVGRESRNLPAIVMPHGGPSARDEWGFDWLPQFFAARGYAVLQPNYRGSSGYGDEWYQKNGFQSWATAIGDVTDSGRWLVSQGIADPKRLAIFGWSYGGYAALQSGAVAPDLFKAIIAVAPVTDLNLLRKDSAGYLNYRVVAEFIGSGPHVKEGSPAQRASQIKAPVMIVHGTMDVNVDVGHARLMVDRLQDAGRAPDYWEVPDLDHSLEDSAVRRDLLRKSDAFLQKAFVP